MEKQVFQVCRDAVLANRQMLRSIREAARANKRMFRTSVAVLVVLALFAGGFYARLLVSMSDTNRPPTELDKVAAELGIPTGSGGSTARGTAAPETALGTVVAAAERTVVKLETAGAGFIAAGSGFIITQDGYVLTNQHVIEDAESIQADFGAGEQCAAHVVASDPSRDLALLKLDPATPRRDFPAIRLGTAADIIVGAEVMAVGFPLGLELAGPASFTRGIVSAVRVIGGERYVQTDADINTGNSGGPLIDLEGRVIGICVAVVMDGANQVTDIGLAIPIDEALAFAQANIGK